MKMVSEVEEGLDGSMSMLSLGSMLLVLFWVSPIEIDHKMS